MSAVSAKIERFVDMLELDDIHTFFEVEVPAGFDYRHTHNTFSIAEYVRARLGM